MTPSEVRWRIERLAVLLQFESRQDALVIVATEAHNTPWAHDLRPPPKPLTAGCIHDGEKK